MTTRTVEPEVAQAAARRRAHRLRERRRLVVSLVALLVLVGAGTVVDLTHPYGISFAHPLGVRHHATSPGGGADAAVATAAVARRTLAARSSLDGTLGYAGDYVVLGRGPGILTWLPPVGRVLRQGNVLYRVDGQPVVLLYGSTPAWRALAEGAQADDFTGKDVAQLNRDLVALGYVHRDDVNGAWDAYGWATKLAVERLQAHLGLTQTGRFDLGQVVFLPTAARVTSVSAQLGGQAGGPVLTATSTTRQVTVNLDAARQSQVKVGERVAIVLPNGVTISGRVASVGKVASTPAQGSGSGPTVEVDITPRRASSTGTLDKAPVQVQITTATARDALAVPVNALLALAGGGYAVEVVATGSAHHLVPVELGLFDDSAGLVQVTGSGLIAGQRVVVPAS
jgi:hypothetical protein